MLPVYAEFIWGLKREELDPFSVNVSRDVLFHVSLDPSEDRWKLFFPPIMP